VPVVGFGVDKNYPSGTTKSEEFLENLGRYQLLCPRESVSFLLD
jgi:hypothetical protein